MFETCGTNAICRVNVHRPQCFCPERHEGDPYRACRLPECLVDEDCPSSLACREKNCRDPCNCPPNTKCTVINHVPRCSCPPGYKGEPNTTQGCFLPGIDHKIILSFNFTFNNSNCQFVEEPAVVKAGCISDGECPSKHACFNGECVNPCTVIKPCGLNAQCLVVDSLPLRTMTCQCLPGYFGNPNVECRSGRRFVFKLHFSHIILTKERQTTIYTTNKSRQNVSSDWINSATAVFLYLQAGFNETLMALTYLLNDFGYFALLILSFQFFFRFLFLFIFNDDIYFFVIYHFQIYSQMTLIAFRQYLNTLIPLSTTWHEPEPVTYRGCVPAWWCFFVEFDSVVFDTDDLT